MKTLITTIIVLTLCTPIRAEVTKTAGGSIRTDPGSGIVSNKGSTLRREWVAVHEA